MAVTVSLVDPYVAAFDALARSGPEQEPDWQVYQHIEHHGCWYSCHKENKEPVHEALVLPSLPWDSALYHIIDQREKESCHQLECYAHIIEYSWRRACCRHHELAPDSEVVGIKVVVHVCHGAQGHDYLADY